MLDLRREPRGFLGIYFASRSNFLPFLFSYHDLSLRQPTVPKVKPVFAPQRQPSRLSWVS